MIVQVLSYWWELLCAALSPVPVLECGLGIGKGTEWWWSVLLQCWWGWSWSVLKLFVHLPLSYLWSPLSAYVFSFMTAISFCANNFLFARIRCQANRLLHVAKKFILQTYCTFFFIVPVVLEEIVHWKHFVICNIILNAKQVGLGMAVVESAVTSIYICYAEDPSLISRWDAEFFSQMSEALHQRLQHRSARTRDVINNRPESSLEESISVWCFVLYKDHFGFESIHNFCILSIWSIGVFVSCDLITELKFWFPCKMAPSHGRCVTYYFSHWSNSYFFLLLT